MPIEKKYDLEAVLKAARGVPEAGDVRVRDDRRESTTRDADADRLAQLARRLGALVNILPLHPGGAPDLTPTPPAAIRAFAERLRIRASRPRCGGAGDWTSMRRAGSCGVEVENGEAGRERAHQR